MNKIVKLIKYGDVLGSRELGKQVCKEANIDNNDVVLDFEGVRVVCNSFADELIGKLFQEEGMGKFCNHVKIVNTSDQIKVILKMVLMNRLSLGKE